MIGTSEMIRHLEQNQNSLADNEKRHVNALLFRLNSWGNEAIDDLVGDAECEVLQGMYNKSKGEKP